MNVERFNELMRREPRTDLLQNPVEWRFYLEFIEAYFKNREIANPVVVEIGIHENRQKKFYEDVLGAFHIGIDLKGTPGVMGDSHDARTVVRLREILDGRPINLLFIDGAHDYGSAKIDYVFYEPMVKNIIAFHDVCEPRCGVSQLWEELFRETNERPKMLFYKFWAGEKLEPRMGIGLIVKE